MTPDAWFEQLVAALPEGTAPGETVGEEERDALLDLARVAAHTSERWTAPISTFLVGLALHELPAAERSAMVRRLASSLETDA